MKRKRAADANTMQSLYMSIGMEPYVLAQHETWIIHLKFHFVWVCASEKKSAAKNGKSRQNEKGHK